MGKHVTDTIVITSAILIWENGLSRIDPKLNFHRDFLPAWHSVTDVLYQKVLAHGGLCKNG